MKVKTSGRDVDSCTHDAAYICRLIEAESAPNLVEAHMLREFPSVEQHMIGEVFGVLSQKSVSWRVTKGVSILFLGCNGPGI